MEGIFYRTKVVETPGKAIATNTVHTTNTVLVAGSTNAATGEVTPPVIRETVTPRVEVIYAPAQYFTNLVPRAEISMGLGLAGEAAPFPYAATVVGLIGAGIGGYASWRNRKNQAIAERITGTLVDNFETLRQTALTIPAYTPDMDKKVMNVVKKAQSLAGVKAEIAAVVEERTDTTL